MGIPAVTLPVVGDSANLWGGLLDTNFTNILAAFGAIAGVPLTGGTVTATAAQAGSLVQSFTGILTSNANYLLPAAGAFYIAQNSTTGAFTLEIGVTGGSATVTLAQGYNQLIFTTPVGAYPAAPAVAA
jgi:hypothetical protein